MYTITKKTALFAPTPSGKGWKAKAHSVVTEVVTRDFWNKFVDAAPFFRRLGGSETVYMGYTALGYKPVRVVSINPDRTLKAIHTFNVTEEG